MPQVEIGTTRFTEVHYDDAPGHGGGHHQYHVRRHREAPCNEEEPVVFASVSFQNGPIGVARVNGCHHEDLLAIVMHRLQTFQAGEYACEANTEALFHLSLALSALDGRTRDRQSRGVEGTYAV